MRKSQVRKIDSIIKEFLGEISIDKKLKEVSLVSKWESLMGKAVSNRTSQIYIRNHILFLRVSSPVLKNELLMMRQQIIDKLNENAGEKLVEEIVIR